MQSNSKITEVLFLADAIGLIWSVVASIRSLHLVTQLATGESIVRLAIVFKMPSKSKKNGDQKKMTEYHAKKMQNEEAEPPMLCLLVTMPSSWVYVQYHPMCLRLPISTTKFEFLRHFRFDFCSNFGFNDQTCIRSSPEVVSNPEKQMLRTN